MIEDVPVINGDQLIVDTQVDTFLSELPARKSSTRNMPVMDFCVFTSIYEEIFIKLQKKTKGNSFPFFHTKVSGFLGFANRFLDN